MFRFPISTGYAKYPSASFLNNIAAFTFMCWVRFATVDTARHQRMFKHKGVTNQLSLRKAATSNQFYASTTVGGALVTRTGGPVVVAGTLYHVAMTWEKNIAAGLKLYIDGALEGSTSTVTQTGNYDSGDDTTTLFFATDNGTADIGLVDLENAVFWAGTALLAHEIEAIRFCGWPGLTHVPRPSAHYLFDGRLLTRILDVSGNGRHILEANVFGPPADQAMQGKYEREAGSSLLLRGAQAMAPAGPGPWITYPTRTPHPATQVTLSGLTPGTAYEMYLTALDAAGNESAPSAIVSAVARESIVVHTEKRVFLGHVT